MGHKWAAELRWERVCLDKSLTALEQRLKQRTQTLEPYHCLWTIPGIRVLGASTFVSTVALANKMAQTTLMVLTRGTTYQVFATA